MSQVQIYPDASSLSIAAAERIVGLADEAIKDHGGFSIALSGGSTPKAIYELLAAPNYIERIDWSNVHVFWGDERCVPPDDVESSYHMARETLLDHVPIPSANIRRIQGEIPPDEAATKYERLLHHFFGNLSPRFDVILLGMGDDGHTASLFPGTKALSEEKRWVIENYVEAKQMWRVTLTKNAINAAVNVIFLVSGVGKSERLRQVLEGNYRRDKLPSQLIKPEDGSLLWMVDQEAAALLSSQ
ncbi:MAG: 6-phosphogluconolactonase [Chloroflexota bacterium]